MSWKKIVIPAVCCLALTVGTLLLQAQTSLSDVLIRFSDGTVQQTAAHNCSNPDDPMDEMIRVGGVCIDKYEASVWTEPDGGTQYGVTGDDYPCDDNGQDCAEVGTKIYARSVPGVQPSRSITWFQAQAALANSGKRLPWNAEWQMAVLGTQDPGASPGSEDCNTNSAGSELTAERANCVSAWGHRDMVGNVWEWVADWVPGGTGGSCSSLYGDDINAICNTGNSTTFGPGALGRGGAFFADGTHAGPFAVIGGDRPSFAASFIGFRGAR